MIRTTASHLVRNMLNIFFPSDLKKNDVVLSGKALAEAAKSRILCGLLSGFSSCCQCNYKAGSMDGPSNQLSKWLLRVDSYLVLRASPTLVPPIARARHRRTRHRFQGISRYLPQTLY